MIYLDNAATTLHKPQQVIDAVVHAMQSMGNCARGTHEEALDAARTVYDARVRLASLFGCPRVDHVAFTANSTEALNMAINGLIDPGDHVISTDLEHNSVLRPLYRLEAERGAELSFVPADKLGNVDYADFERLMKPNTRAVVCTNASNLTGTVLDIERIAKTAHSHGALVIVDASQTAGCWPIDMKKMGIDVLCFTGHKSLLGPTGTGGVYLNPAITPEPFMRGGTGSLSDLEEHPLFMPDVWEAGTGNPMGIAGLGAGVGFVLNKGVENIAREETALNQYFMDAIKDHDMVKIYGPMDAKRKTAVTSININGMVCSTVGEQLNDACGIMVRTGLHCAPGAHRTLGTFPEGTVRFSFGNFSTKDQVDVAVQAILALADYAAENKED